MVLTTKKCWKRIALFPVVEKPRAEINHQMVNRLTLLLMMFVIVNSMLFAILWHLAFKQLFHSCEESIMSLYKILLLMLSHSSENLQELQKEGLHLRYKEFEGPSVMYL